MQTLKNWKKTEEAVFTLWDNHQEIGKMEIALASIERKAIANINNQIIKIKRTGFWKSNLEITGSNGELIAKTYPEKWYSSAYILEYGTKLYKLKVRNNPLAEWVIQENNEDLLCYGLITQDGKAGIKIAGSKNTPYLFDFILWYLFAQIATEQSGEDLTFLALIA
jgi:hypothetical protein